MGRIACFPFAIMVKPVKLTRQSLEMRVGKGRSKPPGAHVLGDGFRAAGLACSTKSQADALTESATTAFSPVCGGHTVAREGAAASLFRGRRTPAKRRGRRDHGNRTCLAGRRNRNGYIRPKAGRSCCINCACNIKIRHAILDNIVGATRAGDGDHVEGLARAADGLIGIYLRSAFVQAVPDGFARVLARGNTGIPRENHLLRMCRW